MVELYLHGCDNEIDCYCNISVTKPEVKNYEFCYHYRIYDLEDLAGILADANKYNCSQSVNEIVKLLALVEFE